jgi:hypothetical protein
VKLALIISTISGGATSQPAAAGTGSVALGGSGVGIDELDGTLRAVVALVAGVLLDEWLLADCWPSHPVSTVNARTNEAVRTPRMRGSITTTC